MKTALMNKLMVTAILTASLAGFAKEEANKKAVRAPASVQKAVHSNEVMDEETELLLSELSDDLVVTLKAKKN